MERRLAAILAADVTGYSRLMAADETGTWARLNKFRIEVIEPKISQFHGRIVNSAGDSLLVEFASAVNAVQCAVEVQERLAGENSNLPEDRRMVFRIGVNLGDVIADDDTIYGDGVNIAARLEKLAEPGGICVGGNVFEQVRGKFACGFDDLGTRQVHNIPQPIRVYRVKLKTTTPATPLTVPATERPSIAVLPFLNLGDDSEQQYFSDGITEDIITELSRFRSLFVIARDSSFAFRSKSVDSSEVGRKLGVRYLVEGSVRKYGDRVRVSGQLAEVESERCLWAEHYDRDLVSIFAVQDEIAQRIVSILVGQLEAAEVERARRRPTSNLLAYDCILRAKSLMNAVGGENSETVRQLLLRAIALDPDCGRAHALLAMTYIFEWFRTESPACLTKAHGIARRSVATDNQDCWCQFALGFACLHLRKFDEAQIHYSRAVTLNPNDADILASMGEFLTYMGRPDEAIDWISRAMKLNPFHPPSYWNDLSSAYYDCHRYQEAVDAILQMPQLFRWHDVHLAAYCAQTGDLARARKHAQAVLKRWPDFSSRRFLSNEPYKHEAKFAHNLDGLLKAGLPE